MKRSSGPRVRFSVARSSMTGAKNLARRAARRELLRRLLDRAGPALTAAFAVALVWTALDRLLGPVSPGWLIIAGAGLAGLLVAGGLAIRRRPGPAQAAADVDASLRLRDRLSSAVELEDEAARDPFAALAVREGDRVATEVSIRRAIPLRLGGSWLAWPLLLAAAVAAAILTPTLSRAAKEAEQARVARQAEARAEAARDIEDAKRTLLPEEQPEPEAPGPDATSEELAVLDEIERQLASGETDPDEARRRAAAALEDAAQEMESESEQTQQELDALRERLANLQDKGDDGAAAPPQAEELLDALRRGDLEGARQAAEDLQRSLDEMSAQERRRVGERLREAAESLDAAQKPEAREPDPAAPSDEGMEPSPQAEQERIREELREQGMDPATADRLAEEMAQERRRRRAQERSAQESRELQEALESAAREAEQPPPPTPDQPQQPPGQEQRQPPPAEPEQQPPPDSQRPRQESGQEQQPDSQPGGPSERQPGQAPGQPPAQRPQQPSRQPPQDARPGQSPDGQQQQQQPGEQQPQPGDPSETPQPGQRPASEPQQPGPGESPTGQEQQPAPSQQGAPGAGQQQPQGPPQGTAPDGEPGPQNRPGAGGPAPGGFDRLRERLDELSERERGAAKDRESAERARRRAQEMLDRMSPEERERMRQWAEAEQREQSPPPPAPAPRPADATPPRTEPVDARQEGGAPDRVIAEWFSDQPQPPGGEPAPIEERRVREAVSGAERALEEQPAPRRYRDVLRRYFESFREGAGERPAPAPTAPDAEPGGDGG